MSPALQKSLAEWLVALFFVGAAALVLFFGAGPFIKADLSESARLYIVGFVLLVGLALILQTACVLTWQLARWVYRLVRREG